MLQKFNLEFSSLTHFTMQTLMANTCIMVKLIMSGIVYLKNFSRLSIPQIRLRLAAMQWTLH